MTTKFRRFALSTTAALAVAALLGAASPANAAAPSPARPLTAVPASTDAPSLTGSAQLQRPDAQVVRFWFDVHGFATDAKGTFGFSHRDGDQHGWAKLEADCLITGGPVAVVTGFITETNVPELKGKRKGVSVLDNGRRDRLGYSWGISHDVDVPECMSMAPFETVRTGDFKVEHWLPFPN